MCVCMSAKGICACADAGADAVRVAVHVLRTHLPKPFFLLNSSSALFKSSLSSTKCSLCTSSTSLDTSRRRRSPIRRTARVGCAMGVGVGCERRNQKKNVSGAQTKKALELFCLQSPAQLQRTSAVAAHLKGQGVNSIR